jgi:hypothetical protein
MTDDEKRRFGEWLLDFIENAPSSPLIEETDQSIAASRQADARAQADPRGIGVSDAYIVEDGPAEDLSPEDFNDDEREDDS